MIDFVAPLSEVSTSRLLGGNQRGRKAARVAERGDGTAFGVVFPGCSQVARFAAREAFHQLFGVGGDDVVLNGIQGRRGSAVGFRNLAAGTELQIAVQLLNSNAALFDSIKSQGGIICSQIFRFKVAGLLNNILIG